MNIRRAIGTFLSAAIIASVALASTTSGARADGALPDGDDYSIEVALPFTFEFCGQQYESVFVSSNGNLTFGTFDASFAESESGFLNGPPRIAPLWDDLWPGVGQLSYVDDSDTFTVNWTGVPEFGSPGANTFAVTLFRDTNKILFNYGAISASDGLVGVTCGGNGPAGSVEEVDFSATLGDAIDLDGRNAVYQLFPGGGDNLDLASANVVFEPEPPASVTMKKMVWDPEDLVYKYDRGNWGFALGPDSGSLSPVSSGDTVPLEFGVVWTAEDVRGGWLFDGSTTMLVEDGTCPESGPEIVEVTLGPDTVMSSHVLTEDDPDITECLYNRLATGFVRVEKATFGNGVATDEREGWTVAVTGCGYHAIGVTDEDGIALFDNVPPCSEVTVQEDSASKPGFVPLPVSALKVVSVTAGNITSVTFRNDRNDPCVDCDPTATPVTPRPTGTAVATPDPSETVTVSPSATPDASAIAPTSVPPTPRPPTAGTGAGASASSMTAPLIAIAMLFVASGIAVTAIGRRRS